MKSISIPKSAYQKLVDKARLLDQVVTLMRGKYPLEDYTGTRIKEFEKSDKISPKLKKDISSILNIAKSG